MLRTVTINDAEELLEIYKPYILETPISFELEIPSLENFRGRIMSIQGKFPWLVYETEHKIVGYAYAGPFKERAAYSWSVECSVYVRKGFHGKGIGKALYASLLEILKAQGVVNVIGGMTLPNEASSKLHEHFGFVKVAEFKDAGFKLGQWWSVGYWQLQLQKPDKPRPLQTPQQTD